MLDTIITTRDDLTPEQREALEQSGFRLVRVLGGSRYRVRGSGDRAALQAFDFVVDVEDTPPEVVLDRALIAAVDSSTSTAGATPGEGTEAVPATISVLCTLDPDLDVDDTVQALAALGTVRDRSGKRVLVDVDVTSVPELAALPGVESAEVEPRNETQNNVARVLTTVQPVATDVGLDGASEIVGVADSGLDTGVNDATMHDDFEGRIVALRATVNKAAFGVADAADLNNHGTHVCGSILGNGAKSNGNISGMAPAAQVTMLAMGPNNSTGLSVPLDLTTGVFQDAYTDGARLHSNSWGSNGSAGAYTAFSSDVDEFTRDNPDMLVVFAAGNEGANGAGSVSAPGTAKNCLTVGASESVRPLPAAISINPNIQDDDHNPATPPTNVPLTLNGWDAQADDADDIAGFSGQGPTDDGRIKPDLVAPGTFILSCRSQISTADVGPDGLGHSANLDAFYADDADGVATHAEAVGIGLPGAPTFGAWTPNTPDAPAGSGPDYQDNYFYSNGTSMATPITTGATTLLRQYLREQRGHQPSAALLKAMLVNAARLPAGASNAPDNVRGFGWLDLDTAIRPTPTGRQGFSDDVDLAVATGDVRSFDVQLADTASPFRVTLAYTDREGAGIQNSLYLRVIEPDGVTTHDGDLTAFPAVSNNVQRVVIDTPPAGTYTVEVHGVNVLFGIAAHPGETRQDFALAVINGIGFSPDPVDVCQVIDKSGSMGFYGYMEPVKERAQQLVSMMRIDDRAGAVAFDTAASDVHDVIPITGFADQQAINTAIGALGPGGNTSIGGGLELGLTKLAAGGDPTHAQALVLLSDGHENTPPWVGGGTTDSPPGWYGGPDFTEVLPTLPAGTRVYTVSLGVQSDEVLLQDIATLTGATFHGIHGPSDIGELHEIYVHLQASTGGDAVITSGTDSVSGLNMPVIQGAAAGVPDDQNVWDPTLNVATGQIVDFRRWLDRHLPRAIWAARSHTVPVDDTMENCTFMVSWHDGDAPVTMAVTSPNGRTYRVGTASVQSGRGDGFEFVRIEAPQPGNWTLRVSVGERRYDDLLRAHPYTFGAYGRTPIDVDVRLPEQLAGLQGVKLGFGLVDGAAVKTMSFDGRFTAAAVSIDALVEKHRDELARIAEGIEPDTPKLDPALMALGVLDHELRNNGRRTLFATKATRLKPTRTVGYAAEVATPVAGLHQLRASVVGSTRNGTRYQRTSISSLRT